MQHAPDSRASVRRLRRRTSWNANVDAVLREQTPAEYFKELVETSLARQHVQAGDLTEYYLVNLLCQYVRLDPRRDAEQAEPLAVRLARALQTGGIEQRARLRSLGDFSLFMSGFFPDSFRRRLVDIDYYVVDGRVRLRLVEPGRARTRFARSSPSCRASSSASATCWPTSASAPRWPRIPTCCGCTRSGCGPAASATASD